MPSSQQPEKREALRGVSRVALRALTTIVDPEEGGTLSRRPLESYLGPMYNAAIDPDPKALAAVIRTMRKAMIPLAQIAETYVPMVARRLGDAWCADELDFAKVTIGSARLQAILRRFEGDWAAQDYTTEFRRPSVLVGVPMGVQHTMGACVLAGQLRQRGFSIQLDLAVTAEGLAHEMSLNSFVAVMFSASGAENLDTLCDLVACSKGISRNTPVLIGGSILGDFEDICSLTQADLATCDLHEALRFCGDFAAEGQGAGVQFGGQAVPHMAGGVSA